MVTNAFCFKILTSFPWISCFDCSTFRILHKEIKCFTWHLSSICNIIIYRQQWLINVISNKNVFITIFGSFLSNFKAAKHRFSMWCGSQWPYWINPRVTFTISIHSWRHWLKWMAIRMSSLSLWARGDWTYQKTCKILTKQLNHWIISTDLCYFSANDFKCFTLYHITAIWHSRKSDLNQWFPTYKTIKNVLFKSNKIVYNISTMTCFEWIFAMWEYYAGYLFLKVYYLALLNTLYWNFKCR